MRLFMRHPSDIPIEVSFDEKPATAYSIGSGGLAFRTGTEFEPGTLVRIRIPYVSPAFDTEARVVWCRPRAGSFELGVEFLSLNDAFRARMVEQLCHIENYRQYVKRSEGRTLSTQEAAAEWIAKYAASFPDPE